MSGFQFILQSMVAFPATLGLIRGAGNFDDILTLQNFSILSSFITFSWTCQTLRYSREKQKTSVFPSDFCFCLLMLCIIGASVKILDDSGCSLFTPVTGMCRLCLLEKYHIMYNKWGATLNQRSEFFSHCYHKDPLLLSR